MVAKLKKETTEHTYDYSVHCGKTLCIFNNIFFSKIEYNIMNIEYLFKPQIDMFSLFFLNRSKVVLRTLRSLSETRRG